MPETIESEYVCEHPRCSSKPFKRKGDLTRHKKLHGQQREFHCTAQGCNFSFTRKDKLCDHRRAGHAAETLFACSNPACRMLLTKDILPLHYASAEYYLSRYRQCPLPKCNFRIRYRIHDPRLDLDELRDHMLNSHDLQGRMRFATYFLSRGYDPERIKMVCPICPDAGQFDTHEDIQTHFMNVHCSDVPKGMSVFKWGELRGCTVTDELRVHRRTILSLWPQFESHPVWNDIKSCSQ